MLYSDSDLGFNRYGISFALLLWGMSLFGYTAFVCPYVQLSGGSLVVVNFFSTRTIPLLRIDRVQDGLMYMRLVLEDRVVRVIALEQSPGAQLAGDTTMWDRLGGLISPQDVDQADTRATVQRHSWRPDGMQITLFALGAGYLLLAWLV